MIQDTTQDQSGASQPHQTPSSRRGDDPMEEIHDETRIHPQQNRGGGNDEKRNGHRPAWVRKILVLESRDSEAQKKIRPGRPERVCHRQQNRDDTADRDHQTERPVEHTTLEDPGKHDPLRSETAERREPG